MTNDRSTRENEMADSHEPTDIPIAQQVNPESVQFRKNELYVAQGVPANRGASSILVTVLVVCVVTLLLVSGAGVAIYYLALKPIEDEKQENLDHARMRNEAYNTFHNTLDKLENQQFTPSTSFESSEYDRSKLEQFLSDLNKASKANDAEALLSLFDFEPLMKKIGILLRVANAPRIDDVTFREAAIATVKEDPGFLSYLHRCDEIQICQVRFQGTYAVVDLRLLDLGPCRSHRSRLWLIFRNNNWKFFDFEDVARGNKLSDTFNRFTRDGLLGYANHGGAKYLDFNDFTEKMSEINLAIIRKRFRRARILLNRIDYQNQEAPQKAVYYIAKIKIELHEKNLEQAKADCHQLKGVYRWSPISQMMHAKVSLALGDHKACIEACKKYQLIIGADSEALRLIAQCYIQQKNTDEAIKFLNQSLDNNPYDWESFAELALLTPKGKNVNLSKRFAVFREHAFVQSSLKSRFAERNREDLVELIKKRSSGPSEN